MNNEKFRRSRSGARIAGDDYQLLVAWCWALRAIRPENKVERFAIEAIDAASMDDVVLTMSAPPNSYIQVKYAVDAGSPVNTKWLIEHSGGGRSLLKRFYDSWNAIRQKEESARLFLFTNRQIDPNDSLMVQLDGQTDLLFPACAQLSRDNNAYTLVEQWAEHLSISIDHLFEMLEDFRFQTGRQNSAEKQIAEDLMIGHGLQSDEQAIIIGLNLVREWIKEGRRELSIGDLENQIGGLGLKVEEPFATLLIEAIDYDNHSEDCLASVNWVDLFQGKTAYERRAPTDVNSWTRNMAPQLTDACQKIRDSGSRRIFVRGAMRLATWFAVGAELRQVTGFEVGCRQRGQLWSSDCSPGTAINLVESEEIVGQGSDIAIVIGVTLDPTDDVQRYISECGLPASHLYSLTPGEQAHDQVISDGPQAVATALKIREAIRSRLSIGEGNRIHLFLAVPGGLALLLGNRWNRMAETIPYEDLGPGNGYIPTFIIPG